MCLFIYFVELQLWDNYGIFSVFLHVPQWKDVLMHILLSLSLTENLEPW